MQERDPLELTVENTHVLNLIQAMLGGVSANTRAVSLKATSKGVGLYFLLAQEEDRDREEIDDIVFEFEALQERCLEVEVTVVVSSEPYYLVVLPGRPVFLRREVE